MSAVQQNAIIFREVVKAQEKKKNVWTPKTPHFPLAQRLRG